MKYPRIDIEETFAELVRDSGGVVLEDKLPKSPSFENADYVFHHERLVAELKCLTEDNVNSPNIESKIDALIADWHDQGKIQTKQRDKESWRKMPQELQTKIYEISTKSIKRRIQKANAQIRETKRELGLDNYLGMVILANDGIYSHGPAAFINAAMVALKRDFSEIDYVIFFTANLFTRLKETPEPALIWIGIDLQRGAKIDGQFIDRLGRDWRLLVCKKTGLPGFDQELNDMEGFWHSTHMPRE
ncbi:hypothetical protein HZ994_07965 [Akkermansiaceae bacterium]|nr:hypothetical protein HZ994_07965 [Akkermansiaceae bacterium]